MRAAAAHHRRAARRLRIHLFALRHLAQHALADHILRKLIAAREYVLAMHGDPVLFAERLDHIVELFNDIERLDLGGQLLDLLEGQRVYHPQL